MIRYDLICENAHEFDAWFSNSDAYDVQRKRGFVECSHCGSNKVEKQLMAPNIGPKANRTVSSPQTMAAAITDPRMQQLAAMMREMRKHVETHAENVGEKFTEEARKIHYKEVEARGIYGQASLEDARALAEEGINVMPLPRLPEDSN
jgi:hypothetical protein